MNQDTDQDRRAEEELADTRHRILLVGIIRDVADGLRAGALTPSEAAVRLEEAAEADAQSLDDADIEIDFDTPSSPRAAELIASALGASGTADKPGSMPDNELEAAMSAAIALRDRGAALRIVGEAPGAPDRSAYHGALVRLRDALVAKLPTED